MALATLADALRDELQDVLSAERQSIKALPKMAKNATNPDLKKAIEAHLKESEAQVKRVEEAFGETGKAARAKTCDAMISAGAQKVDHYEIATYGALCTWANTLGFKSASKLLKENLGEEEGGDKLLTKLSLKTNSDALAGV
jgi:ferritin-like metal-binding protein YciE